MLTQLVYKNPTEKTAGSTSMEVFIRSSAAGLEVRDVTLARRRLDALLALCGVGACSGYSVITLGGRRPASYASSWNSDSSGNVSLHHRTWQLYTFTLPRSTQPGHPSMAGAMSTNNSFVSHNRLNI